MRGYDTKTSLDVGRLRNRRKNKAAKQARKHNRRRR